MSDILNNMNLPWIWEAVSANPNLSPEFIFHFIGFKLDWKFISLNLNFDMEFIEAHKYLPWYFSCISENPNLTLDFVLKNLKEKWDLFAILKNKFLHEKNVYHIKRFCKWLKIKEPILEKC